MRNIITRSFVKNAAACLVYADSVVSEKTVFVPAGYNDCEKAARYIRRNNINIGGKLIDVESVKKVSALYGMEESEFIKLAKPVNERNKETRDSITKTVISVSAELVYMTPERKVLSTPIIIPENVSKKALAAIIGKELPTSCKFIELANRKKVEQLYALDEQTFIANAREMVDHFHFIEK